MEIAVISGKGGTGKSSVTAAFATIAKNLVLADCDVDAANLYLLFSPEIMEESVYIAGHKARINYDVCTHCGICHNHCVFDAIDKTNGYVSISEVSCDGCFLCSRVCPEHAISMVPNDKSRMYSGVFRNGKMVYGRLAPGEENSGKLVQEVRDKAARVAEMSGLETILLDGPPGIGCPVSSTITGVDTLVVVTEPTLSGFSDLKRLLAMAENHQAKKWVIINKADLNPEVASTIEHWCVLENINLAGKLFFDEGVVNAMVERKTLVEWDPESENSRELRSIWMKINKT